MPGVFNVIHPKLPSIPRIRGYLLNALRLTAEDMIRDMDDTTRTWKHQPVFYRIIGYRAGGVFVHVGTDDPPWNYLDQGTTERWAVMDNPFQAKTSPGWIGSQAGVGGAVVKGRKAMHGISRPGIEARMWTATIRAKNQPKFEKRIYDGIVKGLTT